MHSLALASRNFLFILCAMLLPMHAVQAAANTNAGPPEDCLGGFQSMEEERYADAVKLFGKCLQLNLSAAARALVLRVRAEAQRELGRPDLAVEDVKSSVVLEAPKDVWPWVSLGYYYRDLRQYERSLEALKEALEFDENGPGSGPGMAVYYHTGLTLHATGRYAEAVDAYTKGIPRQPDYGYAYYRRALAHEALGNRAFARQDLLKALEFSPAEGYEQDVLSKFSEYGLKPQSSPK